MNIDCLEKGRQLFLLQEMVFIEYESKQVPTVMVATCQGKVREILFFKVREMLGNFIICQGKLTFWKLSEKTRICQGKLTAHDSLMLDKKGVLIIKIWSMKNLTGQCNRLWTKLTQFWTRVSIFINNITYRNSMECMDIVYIQVSWIQKIERLGDPYLQILYMKVVSVRGGGLLYQAV